MPKLIQSISEKIKNKTEIITCHRNFYSQKTQKSKNLKKKKDMTCLVGTKTRLQYNLPLCFTEGINF